MIDAWELAVRESIRETLARYNHAGDRGRVAELAAQFTPDGVLEIHGGATLRGRAAIAEGLGGGARRRAERAASRTGLIVRHHVSSVLIHDVTPERASSASYFAVLTQDGLDHWGRYRDMLVPREGRWLLAHRLVRLDAARRDSLFFAKPPSAAPSTSKDV